VLPIVEIDISLPPSQWRSVIQEGNQEPIVSLIKEHAKLSLLRSTPLRGTNVPNLELRRGAATVPLKGIDVSFHSSLLRWGVLPNRAFLEKMVDKNAVRLKALVGRWIPNLTARPFGITKQDFEDVFRLTKSVVIKGILRDWKMYTEKPEVVNGDRDEDEGVEGEIVVVKAGGKTDVRRSVVENAVVDMLWFVCVFFVLHCFFSLVKVLLAGNSTPCLG